MDQRHGQGVWAVVTGSAAVERLSPQDLQILRLETGPVRGHSVKVLVLERSAPRPLPTVGGLRIAIAARLPDAPRLRQRLVSAPLHLARPAWADDPDFDIARHVTAVPASGPVSRNGLERIVADLVASRLDRSRPLWQVDVVGELTDGSMALIWRMHHCMADGNTFMKFASAVMWDSDPAAMPRAPQPWNPRPLPGTRTLLAAGLGERWRSVARPWRRRPPRGHELTGVLASRTAIARELSPAAKVTALARRVSPARCVALLQVPLDSCKVAGKTIAGSATVNDVLLAIIAGGLRAWLAQRHEPARGIRVKVPVSLHSAGERGTVGNRDSCFYVDLPVEERNVADRVVAINHQTRERKLEHDADALYEVSLRPLVAQWAMSPRVFTLNVSNVRGPGGPVYVLGSRVRELYALSEIAQEHALRIATISSDQVLYIGLLADARAVPDLPVLAGGIRQSSQEVLAYAP